MSTVNMEINSKGKTLYSIATAALSVNFYEIFEVEICMVLTLTFRMVQVQMQTCQSKACWPLPVLAIGMIALGVCKKVTFKLPK